MVTFKTVPEQLSEMVRHFIRLWPDKNPYWTAADIFISACTQQWEVTEASLKRSWDFSTDASGQINPRFVHRQMFIADTMFLMRSCPAFPEFCRRFQDRDARSTFFELYAARMLYVYGFQIDAKPEIKIKGKDFDFMAWHNYTTVNAEVTAITAPVFSEKTVKNALEQKRTQLPKDKPAVIFCICPESWASDDLFSKLDRPGRRFLNGTTRINAIVFMMEEYLPGNDGRRDEIGVSHGALTNRRALHYSYSLSGCLFMSGLTTQLGMNTMNEITEHTSEFARWVKSLMPSGSRWL